MQLAVYRVVELQMQNDDLKAQNNDLKAQNDTYIVRINAMQTEIAQLQTHQLVAENLQLATQNEQLGITIEEQQGRINYLEYQAEELRDNVKNLDEELDEANETGYTLQERVNVLTRGHTCLQAQVSYLVCFFGATSACSSMPLLPASLCLPPFSRSPCCPGCPHRRASWTWSTRTPPR